MRNLISAASSMIALSMAMCPLALHAQETQGESGTTPPATDGVGSDIVVTALRRQATVQTTPAAITAVSGDTLQNLAITDSRSLTRLVPSLVIQESNTGNNRFIIRSIGSAGEPTVGVYFDEIPIVGPPGTNSDSGSNTPSVRLFDISRTEVLRGPQGTLYGAGSMAGTIRFIFNKPKLDAFEGEMLARGFAISHGGYGYEVNGMANAPLIEGKVGARLVAFKTHSDGYTDNKVLNIEDSNFSNSWGLRAMLRVQPTEDWTIDGLFYVQKSDGVTPEWRYDVGRYRADFSVRNRFNDDYKLYGLTTSYDFGSVQFTGTVSYSERDYVYFWDSSAANKNSILPAYIGTACRIYFGTACSTTQRAQYVDYVNTLGGKASSPPSHTEVFTQEARLNGTLGSFLDWTAGVYHSKRNAHVDSYNWPVDPSTGEAIITATGYEFYRYIDDVLEQTAGFAEVTAKPLDGLALTAGARYYDYSKLTGGATPKGSATSFTPAAPFSEARSKESGWIYKFAANYQASRDALIYASASQGFRPGGVNQSIGIPDELKVYQADSIWNYEVGFKTSWLDRRLVLNGAAYQIDWSNRQTAARTLVSSFGFIGNIGNARIRGAELELAVQPIEGLSLNASGSFNDAVLTVDQVTNLGVAAGRKGDRLENTPRWTWQLGGQYARELTQDVTGALRFDANYIGDRWGQIVRTNPNDFEPGFWDTSARLSFTNKTSGWSVAIYALNLFDTVGVVQRRAGNVLEGLTQSRGTSIAPRTVGLELNKKFF